MILVVAAVVAAVILVVAAVLLVLVDRKCWQDLGKLLKRKTSLSCLCVALGNADGN